MAQAWCAMDRAEALTDIKEGETAKSQLAGDINVCNKIIGDQYLLGQQLGVNGTCAIVLENGTLIPGYRPASALVDIILAKQ